MLGDKAKTISVQKVVTVAAAASLLAGGYSGAWPPRTGA